jgi:hypothetical protein
MWCKHCLYVYVNRKLRPVEIIPGMGARGDKEE